MMRYFIFLYIFCLSTSLDAILDEYRAVRAYEVGDFETSQQLLEPLFVHNQHDGQIAYNLGKIAYKKQAFAQAEVYFQRAAQHAQDSQLQLQSYFDLGNAQVQQKKWQEALISYQGVIERDPEHKEALDMIEQIKKILEQQQQQQNQEEQKKNQEEQDNKENNKQQNNQNNTKKNNDQHDQNGQNDKQNKSGESEKQNNQKQKQQQGQNQDKNSNNKRNDSSNNNSQQQDSSHMNKEQRSQDSNQQAAENNFDYDKREKEGEQKREEHEQKEQKQQTQGQGDLSPENIGNNHGQGKQNDSSNHGKSSLLAPQQTSSQDTAQLQKEQESKDSPKNKEELLLALLEEKDAQLIKKMLKAQVMQEMPRTHGQKNW